MTGITDDMIKKAASALTEVFPALDLLGTDRYRQAASAALEAALAGRSVADQPELIEMPTFAGCTDTNPDFCACGENAICCTACGDPIEDDAKAYTARVPDCPWRPLDSPDQEWSDIFWHDTCDERNAPAQVSGGVGGDPQ